MELTMKYNLCHNRGRLPIGTKVRIRNDLVQGKLYDGTCNLTHGMYKHIGQEFVIAESFHNDHGNPRYQLAYIREWIWSPSMIEMV